MAYYASDISITADKNDVLTKLRANREAHRKIVLEARAGYMDRAQKVLAERLDQLRSGKLASLTFHLKTPSDHTRAYTTAIAALEMHQENTIRLDGSQVRTLILNQWDWMEEFLAINSAYSGTARAQRGNDSDEEVGD